MARNYTGVRIKKHRVYSGEDLQFLYAVCTNTVSNWVSAGLKPADAARPYLFRGGVVEEFHRSRRARTRSQLRPGEFKCLACKLAVFPEVKAEEIARRESGGTPVRAVCPECNAMVFKLCGEADFAFFESGVVPNMSGDRAHEGNPSVPADIGISEKIAPSLNDRVIYAWQRYAGKYSPKTADRHLFAIRYFEGALGGKAFDRLTVDDVAGVRDRLVASLRPEADDHKSKSTVQHMASHLRDFLAWLIKQDSFRRLPRDLADYLDLPKAAYAVCLPREKRVYPSIDEAESLLRNMPNCTALQRRARAIFALAFLGALRADTLTSLRIKHLDIEHRLIVQDATVSRAKNGKSLQIKWFPIPETFSEVVISWAKELEKRGFLEDDALFPDKKYLSGSRLFRAKGQTIAPMRSQHAVTDAFKAACAGQAARYSPHAARHTIAAERDRLPLTQETRKAWSENMGHESEQITEAHYGHLSDDRRFELMEEVIECHSFQAPAMSDADKIALVDGVLEQLGRTIPRPKELSSGLELDQP